MSGSTIINLIDEDEEEDVAVIEPKHWQVHIASASRAHGPSSKAVSVVRQTLQSTFPGSRVSHEDPSFAPDVGASRAQAAEVLLVIGSPLIFSISACVLEIVKAHRSNARLVVMNLSEPGIPGFNYSLYNRMLFNKDADFVRGLLPARGWRTLEAFGIGQTAVENALNWFLDCPCIEWSPSNAQSTSKAQDELCVRLSTMIEVPESYIISRIATMKAAGEAGKADLMDLLQRMSPRFPSVAAELGGYAESQCTQVASRSAMVQSGVCKAVLSALKAFGKTRKEVTAKVCSAIWLLSFDDTARTQFVELGAPAQVVACLDVFCQQDKTASAMACGAAFALALGGNKVVSELREAGVCVHILSSLKAWGSQDRLLLFNACALMWLLVHDPECAQQFARMQAGKALAAPGMDCPCTSSCLELLAAYAEQKKTSTKAKAARIQWELPTAQATIDWLVDAHARDIEDHCTLKCPKCRLAWNDFDNCAALYCRNNDCKANFCALCCAGPYSSVAQAYEHVMACEFNPVRGNRWVDKAHLPVVYKKRNANLVREYIAAIKDITVRQRVEAQPTVKEHLST
jgi:hypothetical protein